MHTYIKYLFITYTWNACNFDLRDDIFLRKQKYLNQISVYIFEKKKS